MFARSFAEPLEPDKSGITYLEAIILPTQTLLDFPSGYRVSFWAKSLVVVSVLALVTVAPSEAKEKKSVDFNRDIRPLLSDRCFHCHGPAAKDRQADLRLDTEEGAIADLGGYKAIDRENPEESELLLRITAEDADERMPPAEANKDLSKEEIDLFRRWVKQGSQWAAFWAYVRPRRNEPPEAEREAWPFNLIDRFVLARLESEGLAPAADADRVTLIRRLSFDLTGLPPSPEEVEQFVRDEDPRAYEKLVDRLLASEHFGERMAMWWLDLVRYADTVGYHGDQTHLAWPYRDYVIRSFNENMPFDQFTREQLAGDLLSNPTQDQLVATCYNRVLQTSHEGGVQLKEYRAIYMADRVRNVSQVWMGATMGCAQCHDHKYDPYTTADFYAMGAFFADIDGEDHISGKNRHVDKLPTQRFPEMPVLSAEQQAEVKRIIERIASLRTLMEEKRTAALAHQAEWEQSFKESENQTEVAKYVTVDDGVKVGGERHGEWNFVTTSEGPVHSGKKCRRQVSDETKQHYYDSAATPHLIQKNDLFFSWVYLDAENPPQAVMLQFNGGDHDWDHRAVWGSDDIKYGLRSKDWSGYRRQGKAPEAGKWVRLEVSAKDMGFRPGEAVHGMAFTQHGGTVYWDSAGVRRSFTPPVGFREALEIDPAKRTAEQAKLVQEFYLDSLDECQEIQDQIDSKRRTAERIRDSAPHVMFTKILDKPRTVRLLPRGNWLDESGPVMRPAIPVFLGKIETPKRRATRLDLAEWLVKPAAEGGVGELTARVQANRFWALLMGGGIARVLDDFGGQGEPPVHPELLDYLGLEFIGNGWDVKRIMKEIVMSRTYRQSSLASEDLQHRDPNNRLYARQSRPRLPAEMIRDNALAISGLLVDRIGGPTVHPYQPAGYYRHLNFPTRTYKEDQDERQWRRGVYVHWQRQFLHPMLKAFDAPSREECTAERPRSNTPVAALVLLNDPTFVEAARVFAERIVREGGDSTASRLDFAFRRAISRRPVATETESLTELLEASGNHYREHPEAAKKLLATGLKPAADDLDVAEVASWTMVARAILNMNETITRN